ncbi:FAD-binding oxidoreductase [Alicyclobacillus shizuokensis]|uniref:FAD-binding oxidoreductase n=1 Tax=Alicyclobacillus shizuokensis TaxID=392014 RepID=UPI0008323077|nr:FAD-binding oxidoreductase [Alicyclobacillus shizuokensis]
MSSDEPTYAAIAAALAGAIGEAQVRTDTHLAKRLSHQATPIVVATPRHPAAAARVLRLAADHGWSVLPSGAGTHLDAGPVLQPVDVVIESTGLNQVVEYSPADMVVTVQAGMPLSKLRHVLAEHNQMLPMDAPCTPAATVGGAVSAGLSGPHRVLYGTFRDLLIGTRIILADGRMVRTGGKVVKNVAGYDVTKLVVGSRGSLGFLTECTFKLKPLPLHRELCLLVGRTAQVDWVRARVMDSPLLPSAMEATNDAALMHAFISSRPGTDEPAAEWLLAIDCHENQQAAAYQTEQVLLLAADLGVHAEVLRGQEVERFWARHAETWQHPGSVLRVQAPPTDIMSILNEWTQLAHERHMAAAVTASLPAGVGRIGLWARRVDEQVELLQELRTRARRRGAASLLETAPKAVRSVVPMYDSPRLGTAERRLQAAVQRAFGSDGPHFPDTFAGGMTS